jgi:hypothetical protein
MILLLIALRAHAWEHTGFVWELQDAPLQVIVDPTIPDADEWLAAFRDAADAWAGAQTELTLSVEMADSGPLLQRSSPGQILVMEDREGDVSTGIASLTYSYSSGFAYSTGADTYLYFDESDIVINDDTQTFVGSDDPCEAYDRIRETVAAHELGHALGLGHTCEEEDICADELLASAVMFWYVGGCGDNRAPNADDFDGLAHLYDAAGGWSVTSGELIGATPREVCFIDMPNSIDADHVEWNFGDGTTAEGKQTCHTFETAGIVDVEVTYFSGPDDDAPRSWSDAIVACATPAAPIEGAERLFDLRTEGTEIEILPTVDAHEPCVDSVRWSVLRGAETLYDLPVSQSLVDVGEYGEYTVVLRTTGFGGDGEEERTVTLAEDGGCSTVRPRGGLALVGLLAAALSRRRFARTWPERGHGARNSAQLGAR